MRKNSFSIISALLMLGTLAGGCTLAPEYNRPEAPIPAEYAGDAGQTGEEAALPGWRDFFTDPVMQRLIGVALENNRDYKAVLLNIERTRAQYQIQRADLLPTVGAAASANSQHMAAPFTGTGEEGVTRQYSATLGFSAFELDLFGRVRSLTESALEQYHSVENDARTSRISLMAEVAGVYMQLVADRELLDTTRKTYLNRKDQFELVNNKFANGVASQLEASQAESIMQEALSNVARYETAVSKDENYLALLLGAELPDDLPEVRRLADVRPLADVPEGLPSSLLERRPDIASAEHRLKAANANIGAARANFFPTISLTGSLGSLSPDASDLFKGGTDYWQFMPQFYLPLFDTGRNTARLEVSKAEKEMAVALYEKSIQSAFREVRDTLAQRRNIGNQLEAEEALLRATSTAFALASARYEAGVDSYLNVLDAQRALYNAQQSHLATRLLRETNALTLFKALGGGWE